MFWEIVILSGLLSVLEVLLTTRPGQLSDSTSYLTFKNVACVSVWTDGEYSVIVKPIS